MPRSQRPKIFLSFPRGASPFVRSWLDDRNAFRHGWDPELYNYRDDPVLFGSHEDYASARIHEADIFVAVLCNEYIDSPPCLIELNLARTEYLRRNKASLIPVFLMIEDKPRIREWWATERQQPHGTLSGLPPHTLYTEAWDVAQAVSPNYPAATKMQDLAAQIRELIDAIDAELPHSQAELASPLSSPNGPAAEFPQPFTRGQSDQPAKVFVSYSHRDITWLRRFQTVLAPLVRQENIDLWSDTKLKIGEKWYKEIDKAMKEARIALFLVSPAFLASEFINRQELPRLLQAAQSRGVKIAWVLLEDCLWETTELKDYQCANDPDRPLRRLPGAIASGKITEICRSLKNMLTS